MHILDVDLDFFLEDCCELAPIGKRPALSGHEPWRAEDMRSFLEKNCGLSKQNKVQGRIFETHDKALCMWQQLIECGKLRIPFSVTHIDTHSDLGIGKPGPGFVLNSVISTRMQNRCEIQRYYDMNELDEANYLLFAIGFRYIDTLINVRNPRSRNDVPQEIIRSGENGVFIKPVSFASKLLEGINGEEPQVAYYQYDDYNQFNAEEGYDFASMAMSPRYSPKEADALAEVFSEYIELI